MDLDKETLILSDDKIFYTVEGEGEYVGQRSLFMRMSMCNLTCIGFASEDSPHGCDSFVSWSIKNKMTFNEIFDMMEKNNWIEKLKMGTIWKLTGGEPLIQQKQLLKLVEAFIDKYEFTPKIDFETNATLMPNQRWIKDFGATFTTSPKLTTNVMLSLRLISQKFLSIIVRLALASSLLLILLKTLKRSGVSMLRMSMVLTCLVSVFGLCL